MDINPIQETPGRWMMALGLATAAAGIQTLLLWGYAGAEWLPACIDGVLSVGLLCGLAYRRVELFGKENYHLLLKCGVKLKVSNSGYKQLKDRLEL